MLITIEDLAYQAGDSTMKIAHNEFGGIIFEGTISRSDLEEAQLTKAVRAYLGRCFDADSTPCDWLDGLSALFMYLFPEADECSRTDV